MQEAGHSSSQVLQVISALGHAKVTPAPPSATAPPLPADPPAGTDQPPLSTAWFCVTSLAPPYRHLRLLVLQSHLPAGAFSGAPTPTLTPSGHRLQPRIQSLLQPAAWHFPCGRYTRLCLTRCHACVTEEHPPGHHCPSACSGLGPWSLAVLRLVVWEKQKQCPRPLVLFVVSRHMRCTALGHVAPMSLMWVVAKASWGLCWLCVASAILATNNTFSSFCSCTQWRSNPRPCARSLAQSTHLHHGPGGPSSYAQRTNVSLVFCQDIDHQGAVPRLPRRPPGLRPALSGPVAPGWFLPGGSSQVRTWSCRTTSSCCHFHSCSDDCGCFLLGRVSDSPVGAPHCSSAENGNQQTGETLDLPPDAFQTLRDSLEEHLQQCKMEIQAGTGPVSTRDGSCLSRTPSCSKCLCCMFHLCRWRAQL